MSLGPPDPVAVLIRRQHGVISRGQAIAAGITPGQVAQRVRRGVWVPAGRGVYRHSVVRVTWPGRLLAATLQAGGLASHRAGAVVHDIEGYRPGRLEIVVEAGAWRNIGGVIVHQSTQMDRADPVTLDGIPCTGLARTVLDLAAVVGRERLEDTVDAVLRNRLDLADLSEVLAVHSRRGRDGCGRLREVLEARHSERGVPLSRWSRVFSRILVDHELPTPELEYRIENGRGELIAQVDLAYPLRRVAIELDSVAFHLNRRSFERDPARRNRIMLAGWRVLSFTWRRMVEEPAAVCAEVRAAMATPF